MANPLTADLLALATFTAATVGTAVDISARTYARVLVHTSKVSDGPHAVTIETSDDNENWDKLHEQPIEAPGIEELVFSVARYVRASVAVAAGDLVCRVTIEAHQLFCEPRDLVSHGLRKEAFEELSDDDVLKACLASTDEAIGYLNSAFTLPIISWGTDLRMHCAKMAARYALDPRGWDPGGADGPIETSHDKAIKWLDRIANGKLKPPDIVDSTPETFEGGSYVVSKPRRGW